MHGLTNGPTTSHGFARSAILLAACIGVGALIFAPYAFRQTGSSGPYGLFFAAALCLASSLTAAAGGMLLARNSPVASALVGMIVRMVLPLTACVAILAAGQSGRQHLAFIVYLLTFYLATLCLDTWLAVKRCAQFSASSPR